MRVPMSLRTLFVFAILLSSVLSMGAAGPASAANPRLPKAIDYWALGDSLAAGTGLGDDGFGLDLSPCKRSWDRSYPQRVASALRASIPNVNFSRDQFLACNGARITYDAQGAVDRCMQQFWWNQDCKNKMLHNQVDTVIQRLEQNKRNGIAKPTLVTITAGINDLEYSSPVTIYQAITWGDDWFNWYLQQRSEGVRLGLTAELARLSKYPNVTVVVTDVHNPFNTDSIIFHLPGSQCSVAPPPYPGAASIDCYQRTEEAVHAVNQAISVARSQNFRSGPIGFAQLHDLFHGHEAPQATTPAGISPCGYAPPGVGETWIQYSTDPASNSRPFLFDGLAQLLVPGIGQWTGDCVHPNDLGAQQFANAVSAIALDLVHQ